MEALEALLTRRSVRRYTDDPVTDADLDMLLRAAMSAPSGFGQRSARFVIVREKATREALSKVSKHAGPAAEAPLAIVVCGDTRAERIPGTYFVHDAVASIENVLTAATAANLGAVWIGVHPWPDRIEAVRTVLALPPGVEPIATIAVGHPAKASVAVEHWDESFVHRERW